MKKEKVSKVLDWLSDTYSVRNLLIHKKEEKVMRIDAYAQVQQLYGNKKVHKVQKETRTGFKDQLQISSKGKDIQIAKNAVMNTRDVREDVTEPLKRAVNAGTYEINPDQFAQKLFEKYNSTHLGSF